MKDKKISTTSNGEVPLCQPLSPEAILTNSYIPYQTKELLTEAKSCLSQYQPISNASVIEVIQLVLTGKASTTAALNRLPFGLINACNPTAEQVETLRTCSAGLGVRDVDASQEDDSGAPIMSMYGVQQQASNQSLTDVATWYKEIKSTGITTDNSVPPTGLDVSSREDQEITSFRDPETFTLKEIVLKLTNEFDSTTNLSLTYAQLLTTSFIFVATSLRVTFKRVKARAHVETAQFLNSVVEAMPYCNREFFCWLTKMAQQSGYFSLLSRSSGLKCDLITVLRWMQKTYAQTPIRAISSIGLIGIFGYQHSVLMTLNSVSKGLDVLVPTLLKWCDISECDDFLLAYDNNYQLIVDDPWFFYIHVLSSKFIKIFSMTKFPQLAYMAVSIQNNFKEESRSERIKIEIKSEIQELLELKLKQVMSTYTQKTIGHCTYTIR